MATPRFDLVDVVHTIRKQRRFVIAVTVIAAVVGGIFYAIKHKKYEAQTEFIVTNPLYSDRNNIFGDVRSIDYFGDEDDVDRVLALAQSDTVENRVIHNMHLAQAYSIDTTDPWQVDKLKRIFKKNYDIKRTEYKDVKLFYTDTDPKRAADVANEATRSIEIAYHSYYSSMRNNVYQSIMAKMHEEDSSVTALTDTLSILRNTYGIYNMISPARYNLLITDTKGSGKGDQGYGVEKIQNVESIKDQLVIDRAKQITLLNQFSTGTKADELPLIQVITNAEAPVNPKGLNAYLTVIAAGLLGFFFSSLLVLIITYYRAIISVER